MYVEALNLNIENIDKYTREEIKNIYKKIALECHPDKLSNVSDEDERAAKIERFKKASIGYKKANEDFDNYGKLNYRGGSDYNFDNLADDYEIYNSFDLNFWKNTYDGIFKDKEAIKNTFIDVASYFFNRGFKNKNHYNPSTKVVIHNINLPITYYDLCSVNKRKLRILLKNVKEPVYITLCCKKDYPCLTRQYIDDDSIEHEIIINMSIEEAEGCEEGTEGCGDCCEGCEGTEGCEGCCDIKYTHSLTGINNGIDLHTTIYINIIEYLMGGIKKIWYVDDTYIDINIMPFSTKDIIVKNKGLLGGDLNIKVVFKNITLKDWKKISEKKRAKVIKLIAKMYAAS
jgi:DnaJ-class molecular chaperone